MNSRGAVLPGVTVTLKSPEALGSFTSVTDHEGVYRVANLPPADYEMKAELQGFQSVVRQTANRDEKLPRKPLPKPLPPGGRGRSQ